MSSPVKGPDLACNNLDAPVNTSPCLPSGRGTRLSRNSTQYGGYCRGLIRLPTCPWRLGLFFLCSLNLRKSPGHVLIRKGPPNEERGGDHFLGSAPPPCSRFVTLLPDAVLHRNPDAMDVAALTRTAIRWVDHALVRPSMGARGTAQFRLTIMLTARRSPPLLTTVAQFTNVGHLP